MNQSEFVVDWNLKFYSFQSDFFCKQDEFDHYQLTDISKTLKQKLKSDTTMLPCVQTQALKPNVFNFILVFSLSKRKI